MAKVRASEIRSGDRIKVGGSTFTVTHVVPAGGRIAIYGPALLHRTSKDTLVERISRG